jgi:FMN hydrolase / 5-amino-6-(5-phospho-D-ribitylamino)uracil phosphatase
LKNVIVEPCVIFSSSGLDLAKVRAISLDLDDTLWPIAPSLANAERVLTEWLALHAPRSLAVYTDTEKLQGIREAVKAQWGHATHDLSALRTELMGRVLESAGYSRELARPAFEVFFEARQYIELYDDSLPALKRLHQRYPLVALSNGNAEVSRLEIGPFFKGAVSAQAVGVAKPHPDIFLHTARLMGLEAQQILHVGDDAYTDVQGARLAGMQAVWLNRGATAWTDPAIAPPQVQSLLGLCEMLGV